MTPLQRYQSSLDNGLLQPDEVQAEAVQYLQKLYDDLMRVAPTGGALSLKKLFSRLDAATSPKGLYFWGGVGRGKTYLMDIFYDSLPFEQKTRMHFYRFMQMVHRKLKELTQQKNPLKILAKEIRADNRVICFDEFFVSDIADAMILGGLMAELFRLGATLVVTSNIVPDDLYQNGLQRQRFLPVIDLLKQNTEILNVDSGIDYRLRTRKEAGIYHCPLDGEANESLLNYFMWWVKDVKLIIEAGGIEIEGRKLEVLRRSNDVVWFEFAVLCGSPRSQNDYIEIANQFSTVLISNVRRLDSSKDEQARRLVSLVDEFYDRNVKLIISAEVLITELYSGEALSFDFERAQSRLLEMQSYEYLARAHKT